jgi:hypothetical protein
MNDIVTSTAAISEVVRLPATSNDATTIAASETVMARREAWRFLVPGATDVGLGGLRQSNTASGQNRAATSVSTQMEPASLPQQEGRRKKVASGLFHVSARYEGTVLRVENGLIEAHLRPADGTPPFVSVDIPVEDVPPYDRFRVVPGATFYWISGYEEKPNWQRSSILTFAGYKRMSEDEIRARYDGLRQFLEEDADAAD